MIFTLKSYYHESYKVRITAIYLISFDDANVAVDECRAFLCFTGIPELILVVGPEFTFVNISSFRRYLAIVTSFA